MRIGLNAYFWRQPLTGSGQYTRNLLRALSRIDQFNDYIIFHPADGGDLGPLPANFRRYQVGGLLSWLPEDPLKVWLEQVSLPIAAYQAGLTLVHYPYLAAPLLSTCKVVVTIHDLIPLLLPFYRGRTAVRLYTQLVSLAAKRVAMVIADSECSKADIQRLLGIPAERIRVIYLAADECFRPVDAADEAARLRQKYHLDGDFFLYVGGFDYRKNVNRLIESFAALKRWNGREDKLVLVGQIGTESTLFPDPRLAVRHFGLEDRVQLLGLVPEEDMPALYAAATALIYPSLYEGFGLPPLEAMACGTPVICSSASSLPEIVGEAALMVDPTDTAALTQAMRAILSDSELRTSLRRRGLERASLFSWEKTARQTLAVYEEVGQER
ncbi:MAG: glycosyltransferase family 4 protein [Chloroflexi bacterium]|nr:glycosyltransferase family 4 protein [Chloroflexota bacterium]MCL5074131.1 glycosyltransferase family 4 protein [Chloroflexota bacterium]